MGFNRIAVKQQAKINFKANYWPAVGWTFLAGLILAACGVADRIFFGVVSLIVGSVVSAGLGWFSLKIYRGEAVDGGSDLFVGFRNFGHVLGGMLWMDLFTFLWSLLFVIPGIIKAISYSMTPYILIDQPEIGAQEALKLSMKMTTGHKGDIFVMYLSWFGWMLLTVLTSGILGIFYTVPYMDVSLAGVYEELKKNIQKESATA